MRSLSSKEVAKLYDNFAKCYDFAEILTNFFVGRYRRKLISKAKGSVLEVGIGTGANLRYYGENVDLIGVDISKNMLDRAKIKANRIGIKAKFKIGKAEKLQFGKGNFNYVIDTLGMCSYSDPVKALLEMKRVCKKGGRILLFEHGISSNSFIRKMQHIREEKHYSKIGCSLLRNYSDILKKAKISNYKVRRKFFGIIWSIEVSL